MPYVAPAACGIGAEGRIGEIGSAPVAEREVPAANGDLANLAGFHAATSTVEQRDIHVAHRVADGQDAVGHDAVVIEQQLPAESRLRRPQAVREHGSALEVAREELEVAARCPVTSRRITRRSGKRRPPSSSERKIDGTEWNIVSCSSAAHSASRAAPSSARLNGYDVAPLSSAQKRLETEPLNACDWSSVSRSCRVIPSALV